MRRISLATAFAVLLIFSVPRLNAQHYTVTDLGTLPGDPDSEAWGMNSSAHLVGTSYGNFDSKAFFWTQGNMQDIGCTFGSALAVNDTDHVTGYCGPDDRHTIAFVWSPGLGINYIGTLPGDDISAGLGINSLGQVVGNSLDSSSAISLHAFFWDPKNGFTSIGNLPGGSFSGADGINALGMVVGYANVDDFPHDHAWVWSKSTGIIDLGVLPSNSQNSFAQAINYGGVIVGEATVGKNSQNRAVQWKNGKIKNLGLLNNSIYSFATAINNSNVIVGESGPAGKKGKDVSHAVIWRDGDLKDLNNLVCGTTNLVLLSARGINDSGQIGGYAALATDPATKHGFLLNPVKTCPQ